MKKSYLYSVVLFMAFITPAISMATPYSSSDLWDISNGVTIDATSGVLNYYPGHRSDIRDMFGGVYGTSEGGNTLFKDYMSPGFSGGSVAPGFTHYVEWHTGSAVTLRSFALHASNDNAMNRRAFDRFQLFSGDGTGNWTAIYDTGAGFSYVGGLDLSVDITAITSQYFRAEFIQATWVDARAVGPRIMEFDGFNTFLDGSTGPSGGNVPEPATFALMSLGLAGLGFQRKKQIK